MADEAIYQLSMGSGAPEETPFLKKEIIYILDQNQGSYSGNQVNFDTSTISNSGKWASYKEAYFTIPVVMSFRSSIDSSVANRNPSPFSVIMKNGFWQLIDSLQVDYNGVNVVQQTPNLNVWASFNVVSTWSDNEMVKYGPSLGFWKDTATSWTYSAAVGLNGHGFANNRVNQVQAAFISASYVGSSFNEGLIRRGSAGGYTRFLTVGPTAIVAAGLGQSSFIQIDDPPGVPGVGTVWYWSFIAKIRLKDICPFFNELPLVKGAFFRMTLNVNTSSMTLTTVSATSMSLTTISNGGRTCPLIVSSAGANQPNAAPLATADAVWTVALVIGSSTPTQAFTGCRLYCPLYQMDPTYEEQYMQMHPQLTVAYKDLYNYVIPAQTTGNQINALLTNGITNPKRLIVVPVANSTSNGGVGFSEQQSCFSTVPATTSALAAIQNFQVQLAGMNVFQNQQQYDFDVFMSELSKTGINGGQVSEITSGLLSEQDFEYAYRYYICDLARRLPSDDAYPKSVQIIGTNVSGLTLDLICFIEYERVLQIRTSDGSLISD